jgi:hypothetical protein
MATAAGSYTGNGATDRTIPLAFTPKFVVVQGENAADGMYLSNVNTGARRFKMLDNVNPAAGTANSLGPALTTNGFIVSGNTAGLTNFTGRVFHYYAVT